MSTTLTHAAVGALLGIVGVLLVRHDERMRSVYAFNLVTWAAVAAAAPDLDVLLGVHRAGFTNVWALLVLPAFAGSWLATGAAAWNPFVRGFSAIMPGAFGSHLFFDLFGYTHHWARLLWPLDGRRFEGAAPGALSAYGGWPGIDAGFPLVFFLVWFVAYAWGHDRLAAWLRGRDAGAAMRVGFGAVAAVVVLLPLGLLYGMGLLR